VWFGRGLERGVAVGKGGGFWGLVRRKEPDRVGTLRIQELKLKLDRGTAVKWQWETRRLHK